VVSVENDLTWFNRLRPRIASENFEYIFEPRERYADGIHDFETTFDVIIVDGADRSACALSAIKHIRHYGGTLLIVDNSDWYPSLIARIRGELGWVQADFHGFGPINSYTWTTSIFFNPNTANALYTSNRLQEGAAQANTICLHPRDPALPVRAESARSPLLAMATHRQGDHQRPRVLDR
jgi:hypothetical protein